MCPEQKQAYANKILAGKKVTWHVEATAKILLSNLHENIICGVC